MTAKPEQTLQQLFAQRYSDGFPSFDQDPHSDRLHRMAARGSCRVFQPRSVPADTLKMLCATALASPTKSDLQQRDIVLIQSRDIRTKLADLVPGQSWIADAPMIAVFCGNNRRQRLIHRWKDTPFANDHLDAFFNAVGDAAIALGAFVTAAEAIGLGCCPISAVRNEAAAVSKLLNLPQHVFPFAGLAFGFPAHPPKISKRLPLKVTCHFDQYSEDSLQDAIAQYDLERAKSQPYENHRPTDDFRQNTPYTWSEDKTRQYSRPERQNFGDYIRQLGFKLD